MRLRSKALWAVAALLAVNAVLLAAQPGYALPRSLAAYFFGPKLVRAEIIVKEGGALRDYRVDRGHIRAIRGRDVALLERDGTLVVVPVAADADVTINGRPVPLGALRKGMTATTVREGDAPASTVQVAGRR